MPDTKIERVEMDAAAVDAKIKEAGEIVRAWHGKLAVKPVKVDMRAFSRTQLLIMIAAAPQSELREPEPAPRRRFALRILTATTSTTCSSPAAPRYPERSSGVRGQPQSMQPTVGGE